MVCEDISDVTIVIPARYGSTRFPGKPLVPLLGKPLIQHVYERAQACRLAREILVATDDARIRDAVEGFGGRVLLMSEPYRSGTDRVAAVAMRLAGKYFVDLQSDEIPLHEDFLTDLIQPFMASDADMGTLRRQLDSAEELRNPGVVKVVTDAQGYALYFSRSPIPVIRDDREMRAISGLHFVHLGLYIYTRKTLERLSAMPTGVLEDAEKLEQLRALEHGIRIRVWETNHPSLRIDRKSVV